MSDEKLKAVCDLVKRKLTGPLVNFDYKYEGSMKPCPGDDNITYVGRGLEISLLCMYIKNVYTPLALITCVETNDDVK